MDLNNNKKLVKERFISKDCFMVTSLYPKVTIFPCFFNYIAVWNYNSQRILKLL